MKNNRQSILLRRIAGAICMLIFFSCFIGITAEAAQMLSADVNNIRSESVKPGASPSPSSAAEKPALANIAALPQPGETDSGAGNGAVIPVIVIVSVALVIIIVLLAIKGKKKRQVDVVIAYDGQSGDRAKVDRAQVSPVQPYSSEKAGGNMKRPGGQTDTDQGGQTERLQGGAGQSMARQAFIVLTDIKNPQRSFRVPIDTRIVIGREEGDIILGHDGAVSYRHCEIIKKGSLFYVNDLKSSNGTFYESARVFRETRIMSGGMLEVGACKYKITIES